MKKIVTTLLTIFVILGMAGMVNAAPTTYLDAGYVGGGYVEFHGDGDSVWLECIGIAEDQNIAYFTFIYNTPLGDSEASGHFEDWGIYSETDLRVDYGSPGPSSDLGLGDRGVVTWYSGGIPYPEYISLEITTYGSIGEIDSITLETTPIVPEPTSTMLFIMGGSVLVIRSFKKKK